MLFTQVVPDPDLKREARARRERISADGYAGAPPKAD